MKTKITLFILTIFLLATIPLAQNKSTSNSIDMSPGTMAPDLPSKNSPPDFSPEFLRQEQQVRGEHESEVRQVKPKALLPPDKANGANKSRR